MLSVQYSLIRKEFHRKIGSGMIKILQYKYCQCISTHRNSIKFLMLEQIETHKKFLFSPCQRSLLFEMPFRWSEISKTYPCVASDDSIQGRLIPGNMFLATFTVSQALLYLWKLHVFNGSVQLMLSPVNKKQFMYCCPFN